MPQFRRELESLKKIKFSKKIELLLLICLFLFSLLIRIIYLADVPPGLHTDEVVSAYDAYSVLTTGKDSNGNFLPLYFKAVGDYRDPIHTYSILVSMLFFGVNDFSIRFPSAFYGTLTVVVTYFLAKELFNKKIAIFAALFLSISPWHFVFSRIAFHVITAPFFFVLGFYLIIKGIRKNRNYLMAAAVVLGLSLYTYYSMRLFVPLFLFGMFLIFRKFFLAHKKESIIALAIFAAMSLPMIYFALTHPDALLSRFNAISIFNPDYFEKVKTSLMFGNNLGSTSDVITYAVIFVKNYLSHLSPEFLFFNGDQNNRHSVENFGELYIFQIPLILLGLYVCIKERKPEYLVILFWLLIFSIPADLTIEGIPHALRTLIGSPVFAILSAIPIGYFANQKARKYSRLLTGLFIVLVVIATVNIVSFFNEYFIKYPKFVYDAFGSRFEDAIKYSNNLKGSYDRVVLINSFFGGPDYYIALYTMHDPTPFPEEKNVNQYVDNFCLHYAECNRSGNVLYLIENHHSFGDKATNERILKRFFNVDGSEAFRISEKIDINSPLE